MGRGTELARLSAAIGLDASAAPPAGGRVVLSGDAGIGKSRLLAEVAAQAESAGWLCLTGRCVGQAGGALAYLPFVDILGGLTARAPQILEEIVADHPSLARLTPGGALVDHRQAADPGAVAESVHAALTRLGSPGPALVVVEDVHWADQSSRDLLTLLLTRGFRTRTSLVVTYRTDDLHRRHPLHDTLAVWSRLASVEHLELGPLSADAMRELIAGAGVTDPATTQELAARAEGNPFFAEELAASAAQGRPGIGGLTRVLQARIEALDEPAQRVVRAAAVAGRDVDHALLTRVVELPDAQLDAALAGAADHQVLVPRWPAGYAFRHALLAEAALDSLLPGERLRLHRRYAAVLADDPRLGPASELARHAEAVGDLDCAVAARRAAAADALAIGGAPEARDHLEQALRLMDSQDPAYDEVTLAASEAASAAGDVLRAVGLLRDRLDNPRTPGDSLARADLLAAYANRVRTLDLRVDGLALTTRALELVPAADDERRLRVLMAHVQQLVDVGRWHEATALGDEASTLAERLGADRSVTHIRTVLTKVVEALDDVRAAETELAQLLEAAAVDDPIRLRLHFQLGASIHRRGDLAAARAVFDAGAELALRLHQQWAPWGLECRLRAGMIAHDQGDWSDAQRLLDVREADLPQPGRALYDAALLALAAGRGDTAAAASIPALRQWWSIDGLVTVLTAMAGIDVLGNAGDWAGALDLAEDAAAALAAAWGPSHAVVRMAALATGQVATAAGRSQAPRAEAVLGRVAALAERAEAILHARVPDRAPEPHEAHNHPRRARAASDFAARSPETWAWALRLSAEQARLHWLADSRHRPDPVDLGSLWQQAVDGFAAYGNQVEHARSLARLAWAHQLAGDGVAARSAAGAAREFAAPRQAGPLLAELDALHPAARPAAGPAGPVLLTSRESEILAQLARGRTNGQIGRQLAISPKTVSVHVSNLLAKLGAASRTEAVTLAHERGLLRPP